MKVGETIIIERTPSGLYKITLPDGAALVGGAASTALALATAVFLDEAMEIPEEVMR